MGLSAVLLFCDRTARTAADSDISMRIYSLAGIKENRMLYAG